MMLQEARKSLVPRRGGLNLSREHVDISDSFPIHIEIFFSTLLRMYYIAEEMLSEVNTPLILNYHKNCPRSVNGNGQTLSP